MSHLTEQQRYTIFAMQQAGHDRKINCQEIGKDKSVISRELKRNCDKRSGIYNPELAQRKYKERLTQKPEHISFTPEIKAMVISQLKDDYSPEQIAGRAEYEGKPCVSHETVYQFVWADKKHKDNGLELYKHLRNKGKKYAKRGNSKNSRGTISDRTSIDCRPETVEEKTRFGDLEIDTIIGKNHKGAILTVTDRVSLFEKIVKLNGKNALEPANQTVNTLLPFKGFLHTITSDNGKEFAEHKKISKGLEIDFYFAHPYKSCERGCNENANRLIRQYIPKKTDFNSIDNEYINYVENKLNNRPRKKLGFLSPNEVFNLYLQSNKVAFVG